MDLTFIKDHHAFCIKKYVQARKGNGGWSCICKLLEEYEKFRKERKQKELSAGKIVVAAGFQGVDFGGNITTLGRGGSDLTAMVLASVPPPTIACPLETIASGWIFRSAAALMRTRSSSGVMF